MNELSNFETSILIDEIKDRAETSEAQAEAWQSQKLYELLEEVVQKWEQDAADIKELSECAENASQELRQKGAAIADAKLSCTADIRAIMECGKA